MTLPHDSDGRSDKDILEIEAYELEAFLHSNAAFHRERKNTSGSSGPGPAHLLSGCPGLGPWGGGLEGPGSSSLSHQFSLCGRDWICEPWEWGLWHDPGRLAQVHEPS